MQSNSEVSPEAVGTLRRSKATLPSGEVSYFEAGDGPSALFVHGVFLNGLLWRGVIDRVQAERRCIALDLPAHGQTQVGEDHFSLPALAELLDELCDKLDLGAVDLVGNDSGGAIAQVFAARHPERIRTLTLTNCDTHDNLPPPAFEQTVELAKKGELAPAVQQLASNHEAARSAAGLGAGYEHPERLPEEVVEGYLERFKTPEGARELERFLSSLEAADLIAAEDGLAKLEAPTLIVWGTGDTFFEVSWAHRLRDLIPGAREVIEIEGAKLFFPDERAEELAKHLRAHWAADAGRLATASGQPTSGKER